MEPITCTGNATVNAIWPVTRQLQSNVSETYRDLMLWLIYPSITRTCFCFICNSISSEHSSWLIFIEIDLDIYVNYICSVCQCTETYLSKRTDNLLIRKISAYSQSLLLCARICGYYLINVRARVCVSMLSSGVRGREWKVNQKLNLFN